MLKKRNVKFKKLLKTWLVLNFQIFFCQIMYNVLIRKCDLLVDTTRNLDV
jgi:hypothetical protein